MLHIITRYLRGGSEARVRNIVAALPEADHHVICGAESDVDLVRAGVNAAFVAREPSLVRRPGPKDVVALHRLRAAVRKRRYDLIITHQSKAGVLGRLASNGTPVVHSLSMASFGEGYHGWQDRLFRTLEARLAARTAAYAVVGVDLAERYRAIGVPSHKLAIVRSGVALPEPIDDARAVRERHAIPEHRPLVLYLGSLEERKGVLELPAYAQMLHERSPGVFPFLFIAGEGSLDAMIATEILERRLEHDVRLAGFVDEPGELVAAADVMVLLSSAEGIPQTLIQAASVGTPFVAFEVDGVRELLARGADGTMVPLGDVAAAADATMQILHRDDAPRRSIDVAEWKPDAIAAGYRRVVRSVLEEPKEPMPEHPIARVNGNGAAPTRAAPDAATPTTGLTKRAGKNAAAGVVDSIGRMIVEIAITPILLSGLGDAIFGAWRVLWRWTGYVWAMSGRSAQALQWVVASKQHSDDVAEKQRYIGASIVVWLLFLPLLSAIGGLGAWFAPDLLGIADASRSAVRLAGMFLVLDSILLTVLTIPKAVLAGENLGYKRLGLTTLLTIIGGALAAFAAASGMGIGGVAAAHLAQTVLTGILFWRICTVYVPWFRAARPDRAMVRSFLGLSGWFMSWKLINQAMLAGDVLVLGIVASVEDVTVLSLTRYVPEALMAMLITGFQGAAPGLGGLIGAGNLERARAARAELMAISWVATTAISTSILIWNASFLQIWVGGDRFAGSIEGLLIVAMTMQFIFIRTDAQVIDLTLDLKRKVVLAGVSTALSLALGALALRAGYGIAGLAAGVMAGRMILTVAYPAIVGRKLAQPFTGQLRGAVRPLAATALLFALGTMLGAEVRSGSLPALLAGAGASAVLALAAATVLGLSPRQRGELIARGRRLVKR